MKSIYKMDVSGIMDLLTLNIDTLQEKTKNITKENDESLLKYMKKKWRSAAKVLIDLDKISDKLSEAISKQRGKRNVKKDNIIVTEATEFISEIRKEIRNSDSIKTIDFIYEKSLLKNLSELDNIIDDFINEFGGFLKKVKELINKVEREKNYLPNNISSPKIVKTITTPGILKYHVDNFIKNFEKELSLIKGKTLNSKQIASVKKYCKENDLNENSFFAKLRKLDYSTPRKN